MPNYILCTREDVSDWWSEDGLIAREDDDRTGGLDIAGTEAARTDRIIARASAIVGVYLAERYSVDQWAGTNPPTNTPASVRHYAAIIAAYYMGIRRNLPTSTELAAEYKLALEQLAGIKAGDFSLPEIPESFENYASVSNYTVDGNYRSSKIRVVRSTSTGSRPPAPIKDNAEIYPQNTRFE